MTSENLTELGYPRYFPSDGEDRRFKCRVCGMTFDEDDTQQVQPDGHLACYNDACGEDSLTLTTGGSDG